MNENIPDRLSTDVVGCGNFEALLTVARYIACNHMAPDANVLDQQDIPPVENIQLLAQAGLLGLTTPSQFGGHGAPGSIVRSYTEIMSAACGTTTFVQGQHLSACTLIANGQNELLKETVLPDFASGKKICGVAFAHLRKPGPPVLRVTESSGNYFFNGTASWFTGWGVMTDVLLAGTLPSGEFVYVVIPLEQGQCLTATPPMKLCAMNASGTVSLHCNDLLVSTKHAMKVITPQQMSETDKGAILGVTPQILGLCRSALTIVEELSLSRNSEMLMALSSALKEEMKECRAEIECWRDRSSDPDYKMNALSARARCIEMGVRFAHAAVTAVGGGANSRDHTAQRLFREAMFYTLTAQTRDIQSATFLQIINSSRSQNRS